MDSKKYLEEVFGLFCSPENARELLFLRSWFTRVAEFDPVSGEALHTDIDRLCKRINEAVFKDITSFDTRESLPEPNEDNALKDHLYHICDYVYNSLPVICKNLRTTIKRDHTVLPFHAVRELDSSSIIWLLKRTGRNIREKIADKKAVLAVRRRQSINTLENRLLKEFMRRLSVKLEKRSEFLQEEFDKTCSSLFQFLRRTLNSQIMEEIGPWQNSQPNNILLHDKHYHKIWRAWKSLNALNDKLLRDLNYLPKTRLTAVFWTLLSHLKTIDKCRIVQQPVTLDYDETKIEPAVTASGDSYNKGEWKVIFNVNRIEFNFTRDNKTDVIESFPNGLQLNNEPVLGSLNAATYLSQKIFGIYDSKKNENMPEKTGDKLTKEKPLAEYAIIDFYSTRPEFILQNGNTQKMPFRLLRQEWMDRGTVDVDCGESKAILLDNDKYSIKTTSMKSYFIDSRKDSPDTMTISTVSFFAEKIFRHLEKISESQTRQMTLHYLVPDWIKEFELMYLNRGIHSFWQKAFPLPRSIAGIAAWQSSNNFYVPGGNILVLVIDSFHDGLGVTPFECIHEVQLQKLVPKTRGYRWDRYPTFILPANNDDTLQNFENNDYDRQTAQVLLKLFGMDGLSIEAGTLSVMHGGKWNPISEKKIKNIFAKRTIEYSTLTEKLKELKELELYKNDRKTYILPLQDNITIVDTKNTECLDFVYSLAEGGENAVRWQKEALENGSKFWCNHLPNLVAYFNTSAFSVEKRNLVKDKTTIPMQMDRVNLKAEDFAAWLAKGQNFYEYTLIQGSGEKGVQYAARLEPRIPLEQNTYCRLEMTYTYGEDMPYELRFIPVDEEIRKKLPYLDATFERLDEDRMLDLLKVPSFPKKYSWEEFKNNNILTRCVENLQCLNDIADAGTLGSIVNKKKAERKEGFFRSAKTDETGSFSIRVSIDTNPQNNISCYKDDFLEGIDVNTLKYETLVYFNKLGGYGKNVSFSEKYPANLDESYYKDIYKKAEDMIRRSKTDVALIWNNGRSLQNIEADNEFRKSMYKIIQSMEKLWKTEEMFPYNKDESFGLFKDTVFYFLCCLGHDVSGDTSEYLYRILDESLISENLKYNWGHIGRSIGDVRYEWQNNIFRKVINLILDSSDFHTSYSFEILAVALWRNENLVHKIPEDKLQNIAKKLLFSLEKQISNLHKYITDGNKYEINRLCHYLEVLLALLRTRASANRAVKKLFAPQSELTDAFMTLLENLEKKSKEKNIPIKSRLDFEEKSAGIIDVLRFYLISVIGSSNIMVVGVNEQDD